MHLCSLCSCDNHACCITLCSKKDDMQARLICPVASQKPTWFGHCPSSRVGSLAFLLRQPTRLADVLPWLFHMALQDMVAVTGVCQHWRAVGSSVFFSTSWQGREAIQHPAQLIDLVSEGRGGRGDQGYTANIKTCSTCENVCQTPLAVVTCGRHAGMVV